MTSLEPVLEKVGKILTDQYGIRIVCEGQRCATDGRTIYLPALPDDVPEELWRTIRGYIDHESSHLIFHSNFHVGNEFRKKHGDAAFGLLNILEDLRVERAMKERFPGSGANLDHAYRSADESARELAAQGKSVAPTSPDVSAMTRNIFRRRVVAQRLKTAVTLLIDESHSMNGRKIELAKNTALVLCESLTRLDIPTEVIGFSTQHANKNLKEAVRQTGLSAGYLEDRYRFAPLVHEIVMGFGESFRKVAGRFDNLRTHMLTPLGESMRFAARRLAIRPEPKKILLVLTDGRPTVGMGQDFATFRHAKESIIRIEQAGIDVMLFGMIEPCVLDLHRRAVVVNDLDDLPRTVMAQVRKLLSGSGPITARPPS